MQDPVTSLEIHSARVKCRNRMIFAAVLTVRRLAPLLRQENRGNSLAIPQGKFRNWHHVRTQRINLYILQCSILFSPMWALVSEKVQTVDAQLFRSEWAKRESWTGGSWDKISHARSLGSLWMQISQSLNERFSILLLLIGRDEQFVSSCVTGNCSSCHTKCAAYCSIKSFRN